MSVRPDTYTTISSNFDYNSFFSLGNLNIFYIGEMICNVSASEVYNQTGFTCESNCTALYQAKVSNRCVPCNVFCLTCSSTDPDLCVSCPVGTNRNGNSCNCSGLYFSNSTDMNCLVCSNFLLYCE